MSGTPAQSLATPKNVRQLGNPPLNTSWDTQIMIHTGQDTSIHTSTGISTNIYQLWHQRTYIIWVQQKKQKKVNVWQGWKSWNNARQPGGCFRSEGPSVGSQGANQYKSYRFWMFITNCEPFSQQCAHWKQRWCQTCYCTHCARRWPHLTQKNTQKLLKKKKEVISLSLSHRGISWLILKSEFHGANFHPWPEECTHTTTHGHKTIATMSLSKSLNPHIKLHTMLRPRSSNSIQFSGSFRSLAAFL